MTSKTFRSGGATATLRHLQDDVWNLQNVYSKEPGKGHARRVLEKVTKHADRNGLILTLVVQRYGWSSNPDALDNKQLVEFYAKFGFQLDPDYGDGSIKKMDRKPSQEIHAP